MINRYKIYAIIALVVFPGVFSQLYGQTIVDASYEMEANPQHRGAEKILDRYVTVERASGLAQILKQVEKEMKVTFVYQPKLLVPYSDIEIKKTKKVKLQHLLDSVLEKTSLAYHVSGRHIIITKLELNVKKAARDTVVRGWVKDGTSDKFLPGVNILVKGTPKGAYTDRKGRFKLSVPSLKDTLVFSFVGYKRKEVPLRGRTTLHIKMQHKVSNLSNFVVTGIFKRPEESFTGASNTITSQELQRAGHNNLFQSLKNIDPSLVIKDNLQQGSNPNAVPQIQLRGQSTFPAQKNETNVEANLKGNYLKDPNQPLFVLDGFETTAEKVFDLDMDRVESVTILKDASAKALYGSKGANGVVVIKTKELQATEPIITYNSSLNLELPDLSSYNLTNAREKLEAERIDGLYTPSSNDAEAYANLKELYNERKQIINNGLDTDWLSKPLRNGVGQQHSLSVEIGSQDLRLYAGLAFRNDIGVMKGSKRQDLSGNVKASYNAGPDLQLRNNIEITKNNGQNSPYGRFSDYARMNPYWRATNADGTIPYYAEIGPDGKRYTNPLYNSTLNVKNTTSYINFRDNFYLRWYILPKFKTTVRLGVETKRSRADEYYPGSHTQFEDLQEEYEKFNKGTYQLNNGEGTNLKGDINFNYTNQINKHFFLVNTGFNISQDKFHELYFKERGFPSDRLNNITFGSDYFGNSPSGRYAITRNLGFLAAGSYSFDQRYLADFTFRADASSKFGADKRWAKFWSLGLGWNLHNESFMRWADFLDRLKLRGSVGSSGNQSFNTNASIGSYQYHLNTLYDGFIGSYIQKLANPDLAWERKFDYNAGLDADIANLKLSFNYYISYTQNLITDLTIPPSVGFNSVKENVGKVKNNGFEVRANYTVWRGNTGFLTLNFSATTEHNEIINLSDALRDYNERQRAQATSRSNDEPLLQYQDGQSLNSIWAVRSLGIDPATGNEIYLTRDGNTTYDYDSRDMVVVGNSEPDYRGNFGFNGEYKGFGLGMIFRYLGGGQQYNTTLVRKVENVDINYNVDRRVLTGRWLYPGQHTKFKRLGIYCPDPDGGCGTPDLLQAKTRPTSRFVQDLNQLTIGSINAYYRFSSEFLDKIGLRRLKVGVNMNNIATFSSVKIERGTYYPFARSIAFSLSAKF